MKIGNVDVKVSIVSIGVVAIFAVFLGFAYFISRDTTLLLWGSFTLVLLFLFPLGLNYLSQREYSDMAPRYEAEAKAVRIKLINKGMIGKPVRIEGVVEKVRYKILNRPQYQVADRSGSISVKMFTNPGEDVNVDDIVEVLGQVIQRYVFTGDPIINCVSIKKIKKEKSSEKS
ncbi:MAG: hypothetical protein A4E42_00598 [Methanoregulaceae archaeon PtaU1.Bin222]|nr:MAG: hypothetical protein A4E42_00598 [Methanoregulaceae archaeon PtaU1.Bin222]